MTKNKKSGRITTPLTHTKRTLLVWLFIATVALIFFVTGISTFHITYPTDPKILRPTYESNFVWGVVGIFFTLLFIVWVAALYVKYSKISIASKEARFMQMSTKTIYFGGIFVMILLLVGFVIFSQRHWFFRFNHGWWHAILPI